MDAHCPRCGDYEAQVRAARAAQEDVPAGTTPCPAYVMSDTFREWVVAAMRSEVMAQAGSAGLDRMAIVRAGSQENTATTARPPRSARRSTTAGTRTAGTGPLQEQQGEEE